MSERSAAMNRYREWQSGHWSGDKPEWDEVHGATEDAWLAAEQAQSDLAAEREQRLVEALRERDGGAHDTDCPAYRAEGRPCNCGHEEVRAILATHQNNEGDGGE